MHIWEINSFFLYPPPLLRNLLSYHFISLHQNDRGATSQRRFFFQYFIDRLHQSKSYLLCFGGASFKALLFCCHFPTDNVGLQTSTVSLIGWPGSKFWRESIAHKRTTMHFYDRREVLHPVRFAYICSLLSVQVQLHLLDIGSGHKFVLPVNETT